MPGDRSPLAAMERAARHAVAYRRDVADAGRTPTASYAAMLAAFDGSTPQAGDDALHIVNELVERATPGIRASTGPRFFGWVIGNSHPTGVRQTG